MRDVGLNCWEILITMQTSCCDCRHAEANVIWVVTLWPTVCTTTWVILLRIIASFGPIRITSSDDDEELTALAAWLCNCNASHSNRGLDMHRPLDDCHPCLYRPHQPKTIVELHCLSCRMGMTLDDVPHDDSMSINKVVTSHT